ncbi:MAG: hypothetical protein ACWGQW_19720, partial [bacterium]
MKHTGFASAIGLLLAIVTHVFFANSALGTGNRPNIVWIVAQDISTELACYGHLAVKDTKPGPTGQGG